MPALLLLRSSPQAVSTNAPVSPRAQTDSPVVRLLVERSTLTDIDGEFTNPELLSGSSRRVFCLRTGLWLLMLVLICTLPYRGCLCDARLKLMWGDQLNPSHTRRCGRRTQVHVFVSAHEAMTFMVFLLPWHQNCSDLCA